MDKFKEHVLALADDSNVQLNSNSAFCNDKPTVPISIQRRRAAEYNSYMEGMKHEMKHMMSEDTRSQHHRGGKRVNNKTKRKQRQKISR